MTEQDKINDLKRRITNLINNESLCRPGTSEYTKLNKYRNQLILKDAEIKNTLDAVSSYLNELEKALKKVPNKNLDGKNKKNDTEHLAEGIAAVKKMGQKCGIEIMNPADMATIAANHKPREI